MQLVSTRICISCATRGGIENEGGSDMMIDDDALKQLLRIDDELMQLCKRLNERRDVAASSKLIPLMDDLTHILIEAGKNKLH
jgi:hypothetical protein